MSPRILLLRHGQIRANLEQRWHGSTDSPLTWTGRLQARRTNQHLASQPRLAAIYTSPLQRCRHTSHLATQHSKLAPEVVPGLAEMSVGDWEGRNFRELNEQENMITRLNADLRWTPPAGESLSEVAERMQASLIRIASRHTADETVLVVSHGAAMSIALAQLLHNDPRNWMDYHFSNCGLTELHLTEPARLGRFNDCAHLAPFG